jgi:hypothetical protein
MRLLSLVLMTLLATIASPQVIPVGAYVPPFGNVMPTFFAGTLNIASGEAYVDHSLGGHYIAEAYLYLGTAQDMQVVKSWHYDQEHDGETLPLNKGLSVIFDSTHFDILS